MTFEEEKLQFYSALGQALARWAAVENLLYCIFMVCLRAPHRHAAAAFYAVDSFRSKLKMTDAVVRMTKIDVVKIGEWEALHKRFDRKARARNELAHYEVLEEEGEEPGKQLTLRPKILDPQSPNVFQKYGLHVNELRVREAAFSQLCQDAARFYGDLRRLLGAPSDPFGPAIAIHPRRSQGRR